MTRPVVPLGPSLPVALDPPPARDRPGEPPRARRAAPDPLAHVIAQEGRRRGLKGGPETLEAARSAYLRTEYSGPNDRRPQAGLIKRTDI